MSPLISINIVVYNEEKRIKKCLDAVFSQTYANYEILIFDNDSRDKTVDVVESFFKDKIQSGKIKIHKNKNNINFGPGQNRSVAMTSGKYILGLCADVLLKEDFLDEAVKIMGSNPKIGALQAKIYSLADGQKTDIIDTAGFGIYKSRRIINRGHGEKDSNKFIKDGEIFSYEGACPFWRREALDNVAISGEYHDEYYFWYGDDIDLGWRMHLLGWVNYFSPSVIAWHERHTTKKLSSGKLDFIKQRRTLPKHKKMLDFANTHITIIKNDVGLLQFPDIFKFLNRELQFLIYALVFEPYTIFVGIPRIIKYLPRALKKRREIMKRKKVTMGEIKRWYK